MSADGIHIRPKGASWIVERGNYLLGEFNSQEKAIELARTRAKSSHSDVVIYGKDGNVNRKESYPLKRRKAS